MKAWTSLTSFSCPLVLVLSGCEGQGGYQPCSESLSHNLEDLQEILLGLETVEGQGGKGQGEEEEEEEEEEEGKEEEEAQEGGGAGRLTRKKAHNRSRVLRGSLFISDQSHSLSIYFLMD